MQACLLALLAVALFLEGIIIPLLRMTAARALESLVVAAAQALE